MAPARVAPAAAGPVGAVGAAPAQKPDALGAGLAAAERIIRAREAKGQAEAEYTALMKRAGDAGKRNDWRARNVLLDGATAAKAEATRLGAVADLAEGEIRTAQVAAEAAVRAEADAAKREAEGIRKRELDIKDARAVYSDMGLGDPAGLDLAVIQSRIKREEARLGAERKVDTAVKIDERVTDPNREDSQAHRDAAAAKRGERSNLSAEESNAEQDLGRATRALEQSRNAFGRVMVSPEELAQLQKAVADAKARVDEARRNRLGGRPSTGEAPAASSAAPVGNIDARLTERLKALGR